MRVGDGTSRALRSMDPGSVLRLARWLTCAAAAGAVCWLRQRRRAASPAGSMSADGRRQEPPEAPGSAAQTGGASKQDAFAVMMRRSQEKGGPEGWRKRGRSGLKDTPPVAACISHSDASEGAETHKKLKCAVPTPGQEAHSAAPRASRVALEEVRPLTSRALRGERGCGRARD